MPYKLTLQICLIALTCCANPISAQVTTWRENAENGLDNVRDFTSPSYPLIQSVASSEGQSAFHLANAQFDDNWFEIDQAISVTPGTNLFFTSRLGAATTAQVAKVQLSTDGGQTWPSNIFTQAGNGFPGESSFNLKSIPLSDFTGQDVRVRFLLDFHAPDAAFTQTDTAFGWLVDDIQISPAFDKVAYSFGNPSPEETLYLEYINRSRADAIAEASRLANTSNPEVQGALNAFSINPDDIETQYAWAVSSGCFDRHAQPLAFNESLLQIAELHSQDQATNNFQGHFSSNSPPSPFLPGDGLRQRATRIGYPRNSSLGENVFASATDVEQGHSGFEIDWGKLNRPGDDPCYNAAFSEQGMQNPAGHRTNIHSGFLKEVGIGVVPKNGGQHVVTQNFGATGDARFATGVIYDDHNGNGFYDIGEGRSGVRVDSESSPFYAVSSESGAYSLPISEEGETTIVFAGNGIAPYEAVVQFTNSENKKVDYILTDSKPLAGDFNLNGVLDVRDLDELSVTVRGGTNDPTFDLDANGIVDQADRSVWVHDLKNVYFGDSDLSGEFDSSDFVLMFRSNEYEDDLVGNSTWATGDFNGDAEFDTADFVFAFRDNGYEKGPRPAVAVPEPSNSLAFVAMALAAGLTVTRRPALSKHGSPK